MPAGYNELYRLKACAQLIPYGFLHPLIPDSGRRPLQYFLRTPVASQWHVKITKK